MSQPHVFVSYSHQDDAFARRLVADLQRAGAQVWYDVTGIDHGDFMKRIDEALRQCEWLVLVLSPSAVASPYVQMEANAALHRVQQGLMRAVIPVLAAPYPPNSIPALWDVLHRYDATRDYATALAGVLRAVGLSLVTAASTSQASVPAPTWPSSPTIPSERFPPRLAELGFEGYIVNGIEVIVPPLCDVPAGEFLMGSDPQQDGQSRHNEMPRHPVTLPAFRIGRFPVTVAEYVCFVRTGQVEPASWQKQLAKLDHPVTAITMYEVRDYARWLAYVTSQPWGLPTEAEWEKAARWDPAARHARIYPWGDAFEQWRCNTSGARKGTTPVGSYPAGASPCGAQDMAGNVWEWTSSLLKSYPYRFDDGRERVDSTDNRVLRGGSWYASSAAARAAHRNGDNPTTSPFDVGFRVAAASTS